MTALSSFDPVRQTNFSAARTRRASRRRRPRRSTLTPSPWRAAGELDDRGGGAGQADLARVDAQVGQRQRLHRLLLGGHDALEGGVARLVDRVPGATRSPAAAPRPPRSPPRSAARSCATPPSTVSLRAPVSCGDAEPLGEQRGITDSRASVDSAPQMTRSYSSCRARRRAPSRSAPRTSRAAPSSRTCTALSAPIDSALRIDSVAGSGPMVRTVTSPPCASLSRSASSMAYSSISLMTLLAGARSTVLSAGSQLALAAGVGHLLDQYDDVHRRDHPPCRSWTRAEPASLPIIEVTSG